MTKKIIHIAVLSLLFTSQIAVCGPYNNDQEEEKKKPEENTFLFINAKQHPYIVHAVQAALVLATLYLTYELYQASIASEQTVPALSQDLPKKTVALPMPQLETAPIVVQPVPSSTQVTMNFPQDGWFVNWFKEHLWWGK